MIQRPSIPHHPKFISKIDSILIPDPPAKMVMDKQVIPPMIEFYHGGIPILDLTYGMGRFWDLWDPGTDLVGMDLAAYHPDPNNGPGSVISTAPVRADYRRLPFQDRTFGTIIFDPPHLKRSSNENKTSVYGFYNIVAFDRNFDLPAQEISRVLQPGGVVICKIADEMSRGYFHHQDLQIALHNAGFKWFDLIMKLRGPSIRNTAQKQWRARKCHCFFLIGRKVHPNRLAPRKTKRLTI